MMMKVQDSAEAGHFVGNALAESEPLFFFDVGVARNLRAQKLIGGAQTPSHHGKQVHGGVWMLVNEIQQSLTVHAQQLRIFTRQRRGGAGAAVKKRELADHVTLFIFREDQFLPFHALNEQFNASGTQNEDFAAGIAVMKNRFAFFEVAAVHHLGQRFTLFVVKQSKDGNISDHRYSCRHERTLLREEFTAKG